MDDDFDSKDFPQVGRLFPLPGVVLFPHAVLPLHIFEPRYRQMTEDALATDRMIVIVQVRPPSKWESPGQPTLERFGCLGRIFKHERLPDGRFNFLLVGRKRVELTREIEGGKPYRMSEVRVVEDVDPDESAERDRLELIGLFRDAFQGGLDPDLDALFDTELPMGVLTDIIAQAMGLTSSVKQDLLAEPRVDRRSAEIIQRLRRMKDQPSRPEDKPSSFPPPFSIN